MKIRTDIDIYEHLKKLNYPDYPAFFIYELIKKHNYQIDNIEYFLKEVDEELLKEYEELRKIVKDKFSSRIQKDYEEEDERNELISIEYDMSVFECDCDGNPDRVDNFEKILLSVVQDDKK